MSLGFLFIVIRPFNHKLEAQTEACVFSNITSFRKKCANHFLVLDRYVAMHTMQESENPPTSISSDYLSGGDGNGYPDGSLHGRGQHRLAREGRSLKLVFVAVVGMLLPLITQIGHAH